TVLVPTFSFLPPLPVRYLILTRTQVCAYSSPCLGEGATASACTSSRTRSKCPLGLLRNLSSPTGWFISSACACLLSRGCRIPLELPVPADEARLNCLAVPGLG